MPIKIHISYTDARERELVLQLLHPLVKKGCKVKETKRNNFHHIYITPLPIKNKP